MGNGADTGWNNQYTQTDELKSQAICSLPPFHSKENFSVKVVIFQYVTDTAKIRKENCNC